MEREGSGFKKIMEDYTAEVAHNTAKVMPKFYSAVGCFVVTLPRLVCDTQSDTQGDTQDVTQGVTQGVTQDVTQDVTQGGLSTFDLKLVAYVRSNPKVSTEKLSRLLSCTTRTIKRHLAKLQNVRYVGHGYSGHWVVDEEER